MIHGKHSCSIHLDKWGYKPALRREWAVRNLSLTIAPGQRVLLMGASGIGKSTILQAIAGLIGRAGQESKSDSADITNITSKSDESVPGQVRQTSQDEEGGFSQGKVLIDGVPSGQALGRCGFLMQDPDAQTVFQRLADNVAFGPENLGVDRDEITDRVRQNLAMVGLDGLEWHRSVAHLSGGQSQRLALAGVLAMRPDALLLDEPTSMIDPAGADEVRAAVRKVVEEEGSTLVLVEHQADKWLDFADRLIVLGKQAGNTVIVADGDPSEIFRSQADRLDALGLWVPSQFRHQSHAPRPGKKTETVLQTTNLSISHTTTALASNINLTFHQGEITALTGSNGTGKSTLALTLAGLLPPLSGQVQVSQQVQGDLSDSQPIKWTSAQLAPRIQYVFQNPEHQFAASTVKGEILLSLGDKGESASDQADTILSSCQLDQIWDANPYTLSGGEKRRLTVAAALAAQPEILILDEPTFGQDRQTWLQLVDTIRSTAQQGVCIIMVTHDSELLSCLGCRSIFLGTRQDIEKRKIENMEEQSLEGQSTERQSIKGQNIERQDIEGQKSERNQTGEVNASSPSIPVTPVQERLEGKKPTSPSAVLASLNPAFRLLGAILICLLMIFSLDLVSASVAVLLVLTALLVIGYGGKRIFATSWIIFLGSLTSALSVSLYGQTWGTVYVHWGILTISQGSLTLAGSTALRIIAVGVPALCLMQGMDPTDLADSLCQQFHFSDRFVYGGLAGMRLFSLMSDDWAALSLSRRSRGIAGKSKIGDSISQSFALLVLSIRRSTALATAMQARGFGSKHKRTHWRQTTLRSWDWVYLVICLLIPLISMISAMAAGTFTFMGHVIG